MPGVYILLAGPNAAGKTTVMKPLVEAEIKHYADPDRDFKGHDDLSPELVRKIAERDMPPEKAAVDVLREWFGNELIRKEGIATESNFATRKRDGERFRKAKEAGMTTKLYYIGLSFEKCLERQRKRALEKEDDLVDDYTVTERFERSLKKINDHMNSGNVDVLKIYDNSGARGEERLLLHVEHGETLFRDPEPPEWLDNAGV